MKSGLLQFSSHLKKPGFGVDTVPFLTLGILVMFALFSGHSLFVSHGPTMDLIETHKTPGTANRPPNAVLTIYDPSSLFFEGRILSINTLKPIMREFVQQQTTPDVLLLVRSNRILSMEQVQPIWDALSEAGVHRIIMEAETVASRAKIQ